jgi:hypothetical protein
MTLSEAMVSPNDYTIVSTYRRTFHYVISDAVVNSTGEIVILLRFRRGFPEQVDQKDFLKIIETISHLGPPFFPSLRGFSLPETMMRRHPFILLDSSPIWLTSVFDSLKQGNPPAWWSDTTKMIIIYGLAAALRQLHRNGLTPADFSAAIVALNLQYHPVVVEVMFRPVQGKSENALGFGLLIYQIITHIEPYPGQSTLAIADLISRGEKPQIPENTDRRFADIIEHCCHRNPQARPDFDTLCSLLDTDHFLLADTNRKVFDRYRKLVKRRVHDPSQNTKEFRPGLAEFDRLLQAAEDGDAQAQVLVGVRYETAEQVTRDYNLAARYYQRAAAQGNSSGQYYYGRLLRYGWGVPQDLEGAVRFYQLSADQGNPFGQNNLGVMYENGLGVTRDLARAAEYYKQAADQSDHVGQNNYGRMLKLGHGVRKNLGEAARYFKLSADQNNPFAQNNYGLMLEEGHGIAKDLQSAARYFRLSSMQNHEPGQKNYDRLRALGVE